MGIESTMGERMSACDARIEFNHICREWRMKYAENELKGGAVEVDNLLKSTYLSQIKALDGFVSVDRFVCGGCNDIRIVIKLERGPFGAWEAASFAPEAA